MKLSATTTGVAGVGVGVGGGVGRRAGHHDTQRLPGSKTDGYQELPRWPQLRQERLRV